MQYRYVKIKDVTGETYEFEDCEAKEGLFSLIIFSKVPIGVMKQVFYKDNIIFASMLLDERTDKNG